MHTQILKRLLGVWKLLEDYDHRVRCFLSSSGTGLDETNAANFQIMPAIRGNAGEVYVVFGGFYYESHVAVQRYERYILCNITPPCAYPPSSSCWTTHRYLTHSWQATNISLHHTVHTQVPDPLLAGHQPLPAPHCGSVKVQEQPIRRSQEDYPDHITKQSLTAHTRDRLVN